MARYFGEVKALSLDLRQRVADALDALEEGQTQTSIAKRFAVSRSSVERIARKRREGQGLEPGVPAGKKPLVEREQQEAFAHLAAWRTDWTLQTLAQAWQEQAGKALSQATTSRTLRRSGFSFKKCRVARERDEAKRHAFREQVEALDPGGLVFLDESGFSLALSVLYGGGKKGEPLIEAVPVRRGTNLSVLGALDIPCWVPWTSRAWFLPPTSWER